MTVTHDTDSLTGIETEMQCAAAGRLAERLRYEFPEELSDDELKKCFERYAKEAAEDPNKEAADGSNQDGDQLVSDGLRFARLGRKRDAKVLLAQPEADTGPEAWLPIFRDAQRLVEDELRPAIKAVAHELTRNPDDLHNEDVARRAAEALGRTEP